MDNLLQVRPGLAAEAALYAAAQGPARQETPAHEDGGLERGQGGLQAGKSLERRLFKLLPLFLTIILAIVSSYFES